jgi:hypothetical protein
MEFVADLVDQKIITNLRDDVSGKRCFLIFEMPLDVLSEDIMGNRFLQGSSLIRVQVYHLRNDQSV